MNDDMLKVLAENKGVIHINFGSSFLSKASRDKFNDMKAALLNFKVENKLSEEDQVYKDFRNEYIANNNPYENLKTAADHIDHVVELVGIDYVGFGSDFDGSTENCLALEILAFLFKNEPVE